MRVCTVTTGDFLQSAGDPSRAVRPVLLWSKDSGFPATYEAGWSAFYRVHAREPEQVLVLPDYVASRYRWDEAKHGPKRNVTGMLGKTPAWKFGPAWAQSLSWAGNRSL